MNQYSISENSPFIIDDEEENEESISLQPVNFAPLLPSTDSSSSEFIKESSRLAALPKDTLHIVSLEHDGVGLLKMPNDGGSFFESFLNMANSIIGAVLTIVVDWTIRLLVYNSKLSGRNSYQDVVYFCFGKGGHISISLFQLAFAFGGMCAFCVIIGDTIPHVIASVFPQIIDIPILRLFTDRYFIIIFCTAFISYPLSLYRDISKLAKASGLALISMVIIVASVVIEGPQVDDSLKGNPDTRWKFIQPQVFQPTLKRFEAVTHLSTGISMLACMLMALFGYLVFTDKTQGNILNNFPQNNFIINIARFCFGFNMFTTLPLEVFVCREVIIKYYYPNEMYLLKRHVIITTLLVAGAMFISLLTNDLGIVLELTGGFSATALAFILPPACFLKLTSGKWYSRKKLPAVACVGFGVSVMILSTTLSITKIINNYHEERDLKK
nr:6828_t:CDS:2 [Entrophospora candida]